MAIVAITGGRDFVGTQEDEWRLLEFLSQCHATIVRHGGCRGADTWAGEIARTWQYHVEVWPATSRDATRWKEGENCSRIIVPPLWAHWPSAGPQRNRAMLAGNGYPARFVGAFPGGRGTSDAICLAHAMPGTEIIALSG